MKVPKSIVVIPHRFIIQWDNWVGNWGFILRFRWRTGKHNWHQYNIDVYEAYVRSGQKPYTGKVRKTRYDREG